MVHRGRHGDRFRLRVYQRVGQRWAVPCVLIALASLALWGFAPRIAMVHLPHRCLALAPGAVALIILFYAALASRWAWVQCRADHLCIRSPFCPLALSYSRIQSVRPTRFSDVFDLAGETGARLHWLEPFLGETVVLVGVSSFPLNRRWLRLWFSPYLFDPRAPGLVLLVDDWLALSRQLDEFRITRQMGHARSRGAGRADRRG